MRRSFPALLSIAAVVVLASQADAGPPLAPPVGPIVGPKVGPLPPVLTPPPPAHSAWLKNVTVNPGKAPKDAALIRLEGVCYTDNECILFGRNLGRHDGLGRPPAGFDISVMPVASAKLAAAGPAPAGTAPVVHGPVQITAWTENLIAFRGLTTGGAYTVTLHTAPTGKVLSSITIQVHVIPPAPPYPRARPKFDEDGDGVESVAVGGTDCDDSDPRRFPGNVEVADAVDHDEDCDPTTFGKIDRDSDGHPDALQCNVGMTGTGMDRYFAFYCGDDCDDYHRSVFPGQMVCDPRGADPTMIVLCEGHSGSGPADPRGAFEGTWAPVSCFYYAGATGHCVRQPNDTGVCVP